MFYSYFYKISFRILKNHRFYKKTGASWFYYHSHSCTTFNLCISSACLRPNLMPLSRDKDQKNSFHGKPSFLITIYTIQNKASGEISDLEINSGSISISYDLKDSAFGFLIFVMPFHLPQFFSHFFA